MNRQNVNETQREWNENRGLPDMIGDAYVHLFVLQPVPMVSVYLQLHFL